MPLAQGTARCIKEHRVPSSGEFNTQGQTRCVPLQSDTKLRLQRIFGGIWKSSQLQRQARLERQPVRKLLARPTTAVHGLAEAAQNPPNYALMHPSLANMAMAAIARLLERTCLLAPMQGTRPTRHKLQSTGHPNDAPNSALL